MSTKSFIIKLLITWIITISACTLGGLINDCYASIWIGFMLGEILYRLVWKIPNIERKY